jgi:chromate transport protein ChrA
MLTAPVLWLNFSLILCTSFVLNAKTDVFSVKRALLGALLIVLVFVCSLSLVKLVLNIQSDSHIWTFFLAKFGLVFSDIPFETSIYLCHAGFTFMGYDFIERTQRNGLLQLYVFVVVVFLLLSLYNYFKSREMPAADQLFLSVKSLLFAVMAYTTMRMTYVFLPQMAVIAAASFGYLDRFVGRYFKYVVIFAVVTKLSMDQFAFYQRVLSREQVNIAL